MTDCYCHILTHVLLHTVEVSLCAFEKWGHVSPLSHKRGIFSFGVGATWDVTVSFTDPFSQLEVLWGPAVFWTCFFYLTYIWRLLCSFLPLCNSICQVRYRPPWTHLSAGAAVFLSSLLSACLSSSVSALRPPSGRWSWPQVSHLEKPPHLANIPVTVRTLTGSNRLCDESKCSCLTIRHAIAFLEVKAPEQEIASTSLTQEDGEYFYLFLYRLPSPLQGIQALWQILILISLWGQLQ